MYASQHSNRCICGRSRTYGSRIFVFGINGCSSNNKQHGPASLESADLLSSNTNNDNEATITQDYLSSEAWHQLYAQKIKDRDDVIAGLKASLLETKTIHNGGSETTENGIDPILSLLRQLEEDKEQLLTKLIGSQSYESQLREENERLAKHIDEMVVLEDMTSQQTEDSDCSTDTEKELEKFKRQYAFLNHEVKMLREENLRLRQTDVVKIMSSDVNGNKSEEQRGISDAFSDKIRDGIQIVSLEQDNDSFESQKNSHSVDTEENGTSASDEKWKRELEDKDLEIQRGNAHILQVHGGLMHLQEDFGDLNHSYNNLKCETGSFCLKVKEMMSETQKKIDQALADINLQNEKLTKKYIREMKLRKKLQNQLVELKGNIRVYCRIRPCIKEDNEGDDSETSMLVVVSPDSTDDGLVYVNNKGRLTEFDMDRVFGKDSSQEEIFDEVVPLVRSALDGFNVCIFAYGQTGSGKTYTMEGPPSSPGINQRALQVLFEEQPQDIWTYEISASVLEIYNETIIDLLNPEPSCKLEVRLKPEGGLYVPGLVEIPVSSLEEVNVVFETGRQHRFKAATSMNEDSSRSHCLLCININGHNEDTGLRTIGRLNLVDLAGSERLAKSHADGARLKEAQNINRSLACLGDVIHALRSKQPHIPYRNSKLTYLLQDSLGGDSKTLMIVQVSPVEKNVSETVCTLNFGQRVRSVETGAATKNISKSSNLDGKHPPHNLNLSFSSVSAQSSPLSSPTSPASAGMLLSPLPSPSLLRRSPKSPRLGFNSPLRQNSSSKSKASSSPSKSSLSKSAPGTPKLLRSSSKNNSNHSCPQNSIAGSDVTEEDFLSSYPPANKISTHITKPANKTTSTSSISKSKSLSPASAISQLKAHLTSKLQNSTKVKTSPQHKSSNNHATSGSNSNLSIRQTSGGSSTPTPKNSPLLIRSSVAKTSTRPASAIDWL